MIRTHWMNALMLFTVIIFAPLVFAAVPQTINYQGYLKNTDGTPVSTMVNVTFRLYAESSGGTPIWQETIGVTPANGIYSVILGSGTALDSSLFDSKSLYLGVQVASEAEMSPRQQITSVPYALRTDIADNVSSNATLNTANQIISSVATGTPPFQVDSTTLVPNLNADMLDDKHAADFVDTTSGQTIAGTKTFNSNTLRLNGVGGSTTLSSNATASRILTLSDVSGTVITTGNLSNVTSTGTITSGTWNGGVIGSAWGGTGIDSASVAKNSLLNTTGTGTWGVINAPTATSQVLQYNGSSLSWAGVPAVTSIAAGTGLTASPSSPITSSGTLSIDTAVVPRLNAANTFTTGTQTINSGSDTMGLLVRGVSGQTASLQGWQSYSGGPTAASISPAGDLTISGNLYLPITTATAGGIYSNGSRLIHTYGTANFFAGLNAGNFTGTGDYNTAIGRATLSANTAGLYNTAIGAYAMDSNTAASKNTAVGRYALQAQAFSNGGIAWDSFNTAVGYESLYLNTPTTTTDGIWNTALGAQALRSNTTGTRNTATGYLSLYSNTSGNSNTASGVYSLGVNTIGNGNTASGYYSLGRNTTASLNTAIGFSALYAQSFDNGGVAWDSLNTAVGYGALYSNQPTAIGNGYLNTALGAQTLRSNTTGHGNTAVGYYAGDTNTTGDFNTFFGTFSDASINNLYNATAIGHSAIVDASNKVRIGNASVTDIGGQVAWSNLSDIRQKEDISDVRHGLEFIRQLRPVEYRMIEGNGRKDFGFIAQDIEALLGTDYNLLGVGGDAERRLSLRYTDFIAPMVKAMQEQQATIDQLKAELAEIRKLLGR